MKIKRKIPRPDPIIRDTCFLPDTMTPEEQFERRSAISVEKDGKQIIYVVGWDNPV